MASQAKTIDACLGVATDPDYPNAVMYNGTDVMSMGYGILPKMVMKDTRLSKEAKLIYCHLSCYAGAGPSSYPSQDLIAKETGIPYKSLSKYLKELKAYGYISTRERRNNRHEFAGNIYIIERDPVINQEVMEEFLAGIEKEAARRKRYAEKTKTPVKKMAETKPSTGTELQKNAVDNSQNDAVNNSVAVDNSECITKEDSQNPSSSPYPSRTVTAPVSVQDGHGPYPSRTVTDNIVINNSPSYNQQSIYPKDSLTSGMGGVENPSQDTGGGAPPDGLMDGMIDGSKGIVQGGSSSDTSGDDSPYSPTERRNLLDSFETLLATSIKPVRDESRTATWRAFLNAIDEGYGHGQIVEAYKHYRKRYFAEQRSIKFAMQLKDWLIRGSGLSADIEMMAAEVESCDRRPSNARERTDKLMRTTDHDLKRALRDADPQFAALIEEANGAGAAGDVQRRNDVIDQAVMYFTTHRKQARNAWLERQNAKEAN